MFFEILALFLMVRSVNKDEELEERIRQLEDKTTPRYQYAGEELEDLT